MQPTSSDWEWYSESQDWPRLGPALPGLAARLYLAGKMERGVPLWRLVSELGGARTLTRPSRPSTRRQSRRGGTEPLEQDRTQLIISPPAAIAGLQHLPIVHSFFTDGNSKIVKILQTLSFVIQFLCFRHHQNDAGGTMFSITGSPSVCVYVRAPC